MSDESALASLQELIGKKQMEKPTTDKMVALLEERRVRRCAKPPVIPPAISIGEVAIAKPGDISVLIAQAKSGKTAFVNGIIAAALCSAFGEDADTFGVTACPRPKDSVIVWFDTEQSEEDAWKNLDRAARRAGCADDPDWLRAYYLVGESPSILRAALQAETKRLKEAGIPIWFVVIDGVADFCNDPNDISESQTVVTEIRTVARDNICPVFTVIHRNEGDKADSNPRGHLGKELIRKAATLLFMEKVDEITTVWSTRNRGAPIMKNDGPRFKWSDNHQMHVTVHSAGRERMDSKTAEVRDIIESIAKLENGELMKWSDLVEAIQMVDKCSPQTAKRKIKIGVDTKILRDAGKGFYVKE